jgi:hypothetical protein
MYFIELNENREHGVKEIQLRANNSVCNWLEELQDKPGFLAFHIDYLSDITGSGLRMKKGDRNKINKFLKDIHFTRKNALN